MAHTDKDRPFWVIRHVENFKIDHDHRRGECVLETLEHARAYAAGSVRPTWRHNRSAIHGHYEEYRCTKDDPFVKNTWPYRWLRMSQDGTTRYAVIQNLRMEQTCWATWFDHDPDSPTYHEYRSTQCVTVHRRWIENENVECEVCSIEHPTCDPAWYGVDTGYRYSSVHLKGVRMTERCHTEWHRPERLRERDTLRVQVKTWNAGDELEDWDFENRQARRSAKWHAF